jgi:hypothetical protein
VKSSYAHKLSIQTDELGGEFINYIPLKVFIQIKNIPADMDNIYIISFSNIDKSIQTIYNSYAILGMASFRNTDYPLITQPVKIQFVDSVDATFENYNVIYFKLIIPSDSEKVLQLYIKDLPAFFKRDVGRIILSDLRPYSLRANRNGYNPIQNYINSKNGKIATKELWAPTSNDYSSSNYSYQNYNHCDENFSKKNHSAYENSSLQSNKFAFEAENSSEMRWGSAAEMRSGIASEMRLGRASEMRGFCGSKYPLQTVKKKNNKESLMIQRIEHL